MGCQQDGQAKGPVLETSLWAAQMSTPVHKVNVFLFDLEYSALLTQCWHEQGWRASAHDHCQLRVCSQSCEPGRTEAAGAGTCHLAGCKMHNLGLFFFLYLNWSTSMMTDSGCPRSTQVFLQPAHFHVRRKHLE